MDSNNCEEIKIGLLMPLMGHLMCSVRQKTSQIYAELGYDITPEAADALMIIQHFDGLAQSKLAHILGKDKASITRLLNSLVKADLVERLQDQKDRRIIRAHITPEGEKVFQQILPKLQKFSHDALKGINDAAFTTMTSTLGSIVNNVSIQCCEKN